MHLYNLCRSTRFDWDCSECHKSFNGSRTKHSFIHHNLCCVRGEAAGGDESDFEDDGEVDVCHHRQPTCKCVYNDAMPAKWSTAPWKTGSKFSCADKHDANTSGHARIPSATKNQKLKLLQRERKSNEQQGRAFYQDQADLELQVRDLQQQLDAKGRDYDLANKMVESLETRLAEAHEEVANASSKLHDLMERIEADIPQDFDELGVVEQLNIFRTELETVIEDEDVENEGPSRRVSVNLTERQRVQSPKKVTVGWLTLDSDPSTQISSKT